MSAARVRVLFVSKWMDRGGAERFVSTVLQHLDRARFEPHLCLFRRILGFPVPEDVPVDVLDPNLEHRAWHVPRMAWRLARRIDALRPDVVVSAYSYPSFVVGAALHGTRHRPRWVARVASNPLWHESGYRRPLMRRLYRRADRVLANSQALMETFARVYPFVRERLGYQPNPTDFDRFEALAREPLDGEAPQRPALIAVGRLSAEKRIDLLLEALAQLPEDGAGPLVLCGDGPARASLERRAAELGVLGRVRFEGHRANPFAWMAAADCFVLSSDYEGSPNALIEAQGLGLPAVATDCPFGPAEIIDSGRTGVLVPPGDPERLAEALAGMLGDAEGRRRMGGAARERARERYAADRACASFAEQLERVVG